MNSPTSLRLRLSFTDAQLRAECEVDTHRTSGPGGQHRNKTQSAVRLRHLPSLLLVTGEERRSQHENMRNALSRLREALAVTFRAPLAAKVAWPEGVNIVGGLLRVSESNPALPHVLGLCLDALASFEGKTQDAAAYLGVSTSSYVRFLSKHAKVWEEANRIRGEFGLGRLKA